MNFDEQFPSLKDKWKSKKDIELIDNVHFASFIDNYNVLEHCLDKQRVKEVIDKCLDGKKMVGVSWDALTRVLDKVLYKHFGNVIKSELTREKMDVNLAKYHDDIEKELRLDEEKP